MIEKKFISEKKLVTIGIINYNYENFIDDAIMSALNQNYSNIELIIVDDFSTDNSTHKIREYEKKYRNIKGIYHEQNSGGQDLAFNDIVENSNGEYILFLSADDYLYDKNVITKCIETFMKYENLDYVYGNIQLVDGINNKKEVWRYKDYSDNEIVYYTFRQMGSGVLPFSAGIYNRNFYNKNKIKFIHDPNNKIASDTLNVLMYTKYGWKRKYIDRNLLCYRRHDKNITYDLKNRIKSVISVMEYAANNFDVSVFMPEIDWSKYTSYNKENLKMYVIGEYYFRVVKTYYVNNEKIYCDDINLNENQLRECVQPLIYTSEKYLNKSVKMSDFCIDDIKSKLAYMDKLKKI